MAAVDLRVGRAVLATLGRLRIPGQPVEVDDVRLRSPPAEILCLDSGAFAAIGRVPRPSVLITHGAAYSDDVWTALLDAAPVVLRLNQLDTHSLLAAMLRASVRVGLNELPPSLSRLPPRVVEAFLADPASFRSVSDAGRALGMSLRSFRTMMRTAGFARFEAGVAWLRAEIWTWLATSGVDRRTVDRFVGVTDRTDFRRSCRRAGIRVPWARAEP